MRFYVPNIKNRAQLELSGEAHTHAAYALRIRQGDVITVFDGNGNDYTCKVEEIKKDRTVLRVIDTAQNIGEADLSVTLFLSVIKQDRFEWAVQKATELGVRRVVPVYTAYAQHNIKLNYERLNKIAVSACEQCGRSIVPAIEHSIDFDELLRRTQNAFTIFPWEREISGQLGDAMDRSIKDISVFVGPEGGISEVEMQRLVENGAKSVTLGKRILRAETAAIATLSVIFYEMGEWRI